MVKTMKERKYSSFRLVKEKALAKTREEEKRKQELMDRIPVLPNDCVPLILIRLPIDALHRPMFVSKDWFYAINNENFIEEHLHGSETVLIFLSSTRTVQQNVVMTSIFSESPNIFSVEAELVKRTSAIFFDKSLVHPGLKFHMKFLEIKDDKCRVREYNISCTGKIRAACNGLVLLDNEIKPGGLVILNPVTRKLMPLPLGTLCAKSDESYGLALSKASGGYKVVHLFRDELGYANCEVFNVRERSWRAIDGPSFGLLKRYGHSPVTALGALHWIPKLDRCNYIVSMEIEGEKFHQVALPKSRRVYDGIVELNGCLAFVSHEEVDRIDVWILKGLMAGEVWTKQYSIAGGCKFDMTPLSSLRIGGEMVFKTVKKGSIYVYNFKLGELKKVEMEQESQDRSFTCLPHVNSLVAW